MCNDVIVTTRSQQKHRMWFFVVVSFSLTADGDVTAEEIWEKKATGGPTSTVIFITSALSDQ